MNTKEKSNNTTDVEFFKLEKNHVDFPFYNGIPSGFSVTAAIFLTLISILSVILLIFMQSKSINPTIISLTTVVIPIFSLMLFVKGGWTQLYKKVYFKDIFLIIGTLIAVKVVSILVGYLLMILGVIQQGGGANPIVGIIERNSNFQNLILLFNTFVQLCGEELITIIPMLSIMYISYEKFNMSRKSATLLGWILSAIIFGAVHLSTYNWNIVQAIVGIGVVRLVLTYPYVKTKNLWISSFVHILNDWSIFIPVILQNIK